MELLDWIALVKDGGLAVIVVVVVIMLTKSRDRDSERDADTTGAYLKLIQGMADSFAALTGQLHAQTSAMQEISRTLTDTNPEKYGAYKREILNAIEALPEPTTPTEIAEALQPQFDTLKESIEGAMRKLAGEVSNSNKQAHAAMQTIIDTALARIDHEIDRVKEAVATVERMRPAPEPGETKDHEAPELSGEEGTA